MQNNKSDFIFGPVLPNGRNAFVRERVNLKGEKKMWVSVEEKNPEEKSRVLVKLAGSIEEGKDQESLIATYENGVWLDDFGSWEEEDIVSFWMQIP